MHPKLQKIFKFVVYWMHELAEGYRSLVNFGKEPPAAAATARRTGTPQAPDGTALPKDAPPTEALPVSAQAPTAPAPVAAGPAAIPQDTAIEILPENINNLDDLGKLLQAQRAYRQSPEMLAVAVNDADRDAERRQRIQANLEIMARRELAMQEYIRANAERAATRRVEIENEIKRLAAQLNERETERARLIAQNKAQAAQRLEELAREAHAIFNRIDQLEEERKFIRRALQPPKAPENIIIQELIDRQRKLHEQTILSKRDDQRVEQLRRARELRIKTRAERLARLVSSRAAEIAAEKEALRQAKLQGKTR